MKEIIHYIKEHAFHYKKDKSLYNIIIGAKTHQTYFDACSQELLSLYHSHPTLKYPSFERILKNTEKNQIIPFQGLKVIPRFTFESIQHTFQVIQLLIQTVSFQSHQSLSFIPVSQISKVQNRVKAIYFDLQENNLYTQLEEEVYQLFEHLNSVHSQSILHYYLQGYDETMYTNQQVCLIESLSINELLVLKLNDLVEMMYQIENKQQYPILNQTILLPVLSYNAYQTFQHAKKGLSIDAIAQIENIKVNTVEDHILELFIKGYFTQYALYINDTFFQSFKSYYPHHKEARLKIFKQAYPEQSYFEIKLAIVRYARGDYDA